MSDTPSPWQSDRPQGFPSPQGQPRPPAGPPPGMPPQFAAPQYGPPVGGPPIPPPTPAPTPAPQRPQPQPKRRVGAGFLAAVVLAAGVGAGSAVVADRYLLPDDPAASSAPSIESSASPSQSAQGGQTVAQANPLAPDWNAVAEVASKSVVAIQTASSGGAGQGSGVVIDDKGHVISNHHVVGNAEQILVSLGSRTYQADLVGTDPATDLAVIKLVDPPKDLQPMPWGDSKALHVGDPVMAIGNPLGLSNTVTTGIVSALDRPVTTRDEQSEDLVITAAIQTNAAINPGNSGGALTNASGELIGITSSIASMSGQQGQPSGNIGIGFAIPADQAQHVAKQLIESGKAVYPQMGVRASDVRKVGPMGAVVESVADGSPAAKAGMQVGDVITAIDDRPVSSMTQLVGMVRAQKVGATIEVAYVRNGKEEQAKLELIAAGE